MTLNGVSPYFALFHRIALQAYYVTVVEDRPILSIQNIAFHFWPKLAHAAARCLSTRLLRKQYTSNVEQDAQISQRDRAAGCVIVFAKSIEDWNWETIFYRHYRSIFNHCDIIGLKICRIR